jgi:hypothetical protein
MIKSYVYLDYGKSICNSNVTLLSFEAVKEEAEFSVLEPTYFGKTDRYDLYWQC